jgi:hypothetical protein
MVRVIGPFAPRLGNWISTAVSLHPGGTVTDPIAWPCPSRTLSDHWPCVWEDRLWRVTSKAADPPGIAYVAEPFEPVMSPSFTDGNRDDPDGAGTVEVTPGAPAVPVEVPAGSRSTTWRIAGGALLSGPGGGTSERLRRRRGSRCSTPIGRPGRGLRAGSPLRNEVKRPGSLM